MSTWIKEARWLDLNADKRKEVKLDFMTTRVTQTHTTCIYPIASNTILPPPDSWKPLEMKDDRFPTVECKDPVWECVELFWELKRNQNARSKAVTYVDCAIKVAEVLRFQ